MGERILLTPRDVQMRLGVCGRTLMRWRRDGGGPSYLRAGGLIRYPLDQLERWEQAQTFPHRAAEATARTKVESGARPEAIATT